jgi:hypothetical protein
MIDAATRADYEDEAIRCQSRFISALTLISPAKQRALIINMLEMLLLRVEDERAVDFCKKLIQADPGNPAMSVPDDDPGRLPIGCSIYFKGPYGETGVGEVIGHEDGRVRVSWPHWGGKSALYAPRFCRRVIVVDTLPGGQLLRFPDDDGPEGPPTDSILIDQRLHEAD